MNEYYLNAWIVAITMWLLWGLRLITADPPHIAQIRLFGKRMPGWFKEEGLRFFFGYPLIFNFILIDVERFDIEVTAEKVRTPDRAESKVPVFMTFRPIGEHAVNYLNSGKKTGVEEKIKAKIQEKVREWASGVSEGPSDWRELYRSHLELMGILVKKIASDDGSFPHMPEYAQDVPTWIWLRFNERPRPKVDKLFKNEKFWGENDWAEVKAIYDPLSDKQKTDLNEAIEDRRKLIESLRNGTGNIVLEDLGIRLERMNLGDIDVLGEVAEAAEREAREIEERAAETRDIETFDDRVVYLMTERPGKRPAFPMEDAKEIALLATGKATKTIDEKQISLAPGTANTLKKVIEHVIK